MDKIKDYSNYQPPIELRKELTDIITDCPSLERVGESEYRVYRLRAYSYNRIMKIALELSENMEGIKDDNILLKAMCTDIEKSCEIVAIILCNHLFKPDNITDYASALLTLSENDKMIEFMKARILNSTFNPNQWASIILSAIKSIDISELFTVCSSAKNLFVSMSMIRKTTAEQLQYMRQVQEAMLPTS